MGKRRDRLRCDPRALSFYRALGRRLTQYDAITFPDFNRRGVRTPIGELNY